ncbi:MAG: MBL fold metallo-hydrolase [Clostridiales bacterium]|nr:MBL fold metallo-hydrolase [Clostridiales bacterium]
MKPVDFSAKHDVLIRHKDGTLTPMDVPYYETTQIGEDTWMIMSSGDYHYLIAGDIGGVAFDTGYGAGNLREYLEGLCSKPVPWVVNSHHHFDHTANNCYFDMAYMGEEALSRASIPFPSFDGVGFPAPDYPKTPVGDGDIIPLAGRPLEVFRIGDHTEDGIALLDRKERLLFTGDELMIGMKTLNGSVAKWKRDLEKLLAHRGEFDRICGGGGVLPDGILETFYEAACKIAAGEPSEEPPERQAPPLRSEERDARGRLIYDCQIPHPEDHPKGGFFKVNPNMREFYYHGYHFTYDQTMIDD